MFQYPLNLHCSQTVFNSTSAELRFNTLWIYTALKHWVVRRGGRLVSIPSEFTLLSNAVNIVMANNCVSIPSEFTLLSNRETIMIDGLSVSIPSEFTLLSNISLVHFLLFKFQYPLNLHCSQTLSDDIIDGYRVSIPSEFTLLSNQRSCVGHCAISFNTLWIYTALKQRWQRAFCHRVSIPSEFTLLSNKGNQWQPLHQFQYPLNLHCSQTVSKVTFKKLCFNTLWIYTALKLAICFFLLFCCFNTLWIYTALKPSVRNAPTLSRFQYPLNLHCSQTYVVSVAVGFLFQYPLNLHCSQTFLRHSNIGNSFNTLWIYTALKPKHTKNQHHRSFNTLWIYTALKHEFAEVEALDVSIPSEFTLLSNGLYRSIIS